ncbi:hypothetical protein ACOMHN_027139 [Nucella lapillus]
MGRGPGPPPLWCARGRALHAVVRGPGPHPSGVHGPCPTRRGPRSGTPTPLVCRVVPYTTPWAAVRDPTPLVCRGRALHAVGLGPGPPPPSWCAGAVPYTPWATVRDPTPLVCRGRALHAVGRGPGPHPSGVQGPCPTRRGPRSGTPTPLVCRGRVLYRVGDRLMHSGPSPSADGLNR